MNPVESIIGRPISEGFNPHPARGPGESDGKIKAGIDVFYVSIRTRPEGRVNPDKWIKISHNKRGFQSAPGPRAG